MYLYIYYHILAIKQIIVHMKVLISATLSITGKCIYYAESQC